MSEFCHFPEHWHVLCHFSDTGRVGLNLYVSIFWQGASILSVDANFPFLRWSIHEKRFLSLLVLCESLGNVTVN